MSKSSILMQQFKIYLIIDISLDNPLTFAEDCVTSFYAVAFNNKEVACLGHLVRASFTVTAYSFN